MPTAKVDYKLLRQEYITTDISIRQLAAKHGVSWSAVNAQKQKHGWDNDREKFRTRRDEKTVERLADRAANEADQMRSELLLVLRATIHKFGNDLAKGDVSVSARDLAALIPQINLLLGEPTTRTEAQILGLNVSTTVDPDLFRRIAEIARERIEPGAMDKPAALVPSLIGAD